MVGKIDHMHRTLSADCHITGSGPGPVLFLVTTHIQIRRDIDGLPIEIGMRHTIRFYSKPVRIARYLVVALRTACTAVRCCGTNLPVFQLCILGRCVDFRCAVAIRIIDDRRDFGVIDAVYNRGQSGKLCRCRNVHRLLRLVIPADVNRLPIPGSAA